MPNVDHQGAGAGGFSGRPRSLVKTARRGLAAVTVVLAVLGSGIAGASAAGAATSAPPAGAASCTRTVTGVHHGALRAGSGLLCLRGATQVGTVTVTGPAGLQADGSVIRGALTVTGAARVSVCRSTLIGAVRADRAAGPVTLGGGSCGGDIGHGPVAITGSAGPVQVTGLRQQGPVELTGNTGGVTVSGASIAGTTTVRGNRGSAPVVISGSAITGSLACAANQPAPTDQGKPDTVSGKAAGQCAALAGGGLGAPPPLGAVPPLSQDLSGTLPNLKSGQAVGDFTGAGHDELAYYQDGQLKIANVAKFGGNVVRSTASDLRTTPNDGFHKYNYYDWYVWNRPDETSLAAAYGLTSVKVAASASDIYMAGATWQDGNTGSTDPPTTYRLHLYKLRHDGQCASASCAEKTFDLPHIYSYSSFSCSTSRLIVVTSLAVGVVGGQTLIAVGLSDDGIYVFNDSMQLVLRIDDFGVYDGCTQTPITSMAFGPPSGSGQGGRLAVGLNSPYRTFAGYDLNPDGTLGNHWLTPVGQAAGVLAAGATYASIGGQLAEVFTRSDGAVLALNPDTGDLITGTGVFADPLGVTALTPWGGDPGNQQLVVGSVGGAVVVLQDVDGVLTGVPFAPGGAATGTADQAYAWWPGYGAGRLRVADSSAMAVTVSMAARPDAGYGCWLNTSVDGGPGAFPVADTTVPAGGVSADYFAGALTYGPAGDCLSAQPNSKGEHAAYVIITPAGDPADEHVVKLAASADGTLRVTDQAGGYLTAAVARLSGTPGSWGTWQLTVTGGSTPAAAGPAVQGFRLTSAPDPANYQPPVTPVADDPCRPVYRFDVTGARWDHVAAPGQVAAQIPPMTAQGSTDGGKTWKDLGQLMPSAAPALAGSTVTLGPASFYWQDPPGSAPTPWAAPAGQPGLCPAGGTAPLTDVRVISGGVPSRDVALAGLAAPPLNGGTGATPVNGLKVTPEAPGGTAVPRADGVDQAKLDVTLVPANGSGIIEPGDPRYRLVYYRYAGTNNLVTGLYTPGGYGDYTAVGPYAAAGGSGGQLVKNYLVTTSTAAQSLNGVLNVRGTATGALSTGGTEGNGSSIAVAALDNPLTPAGGNATGGISITGCATPTGACPLAVPAGTAPALYQAGGPGTGPVTGLLLQAWAVTGRVSLPLSVGTANAHHLGSAPLTVTPAQAKLVGASLFFPSDTIDTALVTSGDLVQALSIPVGNGGG